MGKRATTRAAAPTRGARARVRKRPFDEPMPRVRAAGIRFGYTGPKLTGRLISKAELFLVPNRSRLPVEYRAFLLRHNGGIPTPGYFTWKHPRQEAVRSWVDHLLGLDVRSLFGSHQPDLVSQLLLHRQQVPMSFLPIGYAVRDDLLLLGIDDWEETYGQVWIKHMEEVDDRIDNPSRPSDALYQVAPSFNAFLAMLHDDPDDR